MENFDEPKVCEIGGLYVLHKLWSLNGTENVGLYRDGGLPGINSSSGLLLDKMRKSIIALFKNEGLSITIGTNLP